MTKLADTPVPIMPSALPSPRSAEWGASIFVWGMWAVLFAGAMGFSYTHAMNVPFSDEWWYVQYITGDAPVTWDWLWANHSSHRIPIPKFLWAGLFRLTGYGFQVGAYLNVVLIALLALGLTCVARVIRGHTSYTDAFFAIALLNWGHCTNLTLWWQITEIVAPILMCAILAVIVCFGNRLTPQLEAITVCCVLLLPLCGPSGLPLVVTMSVWFAYLALSRWRSAEPGGRRRALLLALVPLLAAMLIALYFHGMDKPVSSTGGTSLPSRREMLSTALQFLSVSLGMGTQDYWRYFGPLVLGVIMATMGYLILVWIAKPGERARSLGLLLYLAAMLGLAAGVAIGRPFALTRYYLIFGAPALVAVYYIWEVYRGATIGRLVTFGLFTLTCAMLSHNAWDGIVAGGLRHRMRSALVQDVSAGIPMEILAQRHSRDLLDSADQDERMMIAMRQMRDAGIWPFRLIREPDWNEVPFTNDPSTVNDGTWRDRWLEATGHDPFAVFTLDQPRHVVAVRITFAYLQAEGTAHCEFYWSPDVHSGFSGARCFMWRQEMYLTPMTRIIWINDTVASFRIDPDSRPFAFELQDVTLLVPKAERGDSAAP